MYYQKIKLIKVGRNMKKLLKCLVIVLALSLVPINVLANSYSYGRPPSAGSNWNLEKDSDYTYVKASNSSMKMSVHYIDGYLFFDSEAYNSVKAVYNYYGFVSTRITGTDGVEFLKRKNSSSTNVEVSLSDNKAEPNTKHAQKAKFLGRYQQIDPNYVVVNNNYLYVESGSHTEVWE